jgi:hypothetical protein|uniref:Uncharacterized protein n=1 Tax=viral metagenome TaxID=1070528 RepID=A0A6C0CW60_9ZZZZ
MNIALNINQFETNNIYFCDPIKNNVVNDGLFIRIIYSTDYFVTNGINLFVQLHDLTIEKFYNKYKCSFNLFNNKNIIENIQQIEENILKNINIKNKIIQKTLGEQLRIGNIKIFSENIDITNNYLLVLKISGIWETDTHIGLTFKFSKINQC